MGSALTLTRRALVAVVLAFGLTLMHGGIGQAMTCSGMASMAAAATPMTGQIAMAVNDPTGKTQHTRNQQPGTPPVSSHHAEMCISTPVTSNAGGPVGGPRTLADLVSIDNGQPLHQPTVTRASGRHPPAPDLGSVLCVIRR